MRTISRLTAGAAVVAGLVGCDVARGLTDAKPVDSLKIRPDYVIDSIFTMDEMLRRFRAGLGAAPATLAGGAASRDALVRDFVTALAARDIARLERLRIDRTEFGWVYFPASPFAASPYELPPEVLWLQLAAESGKGIDRALRAVGSRSSHLDHSCTIAPRPNGGVRLWEDCMVRWRAADGTIERARLFGSILEHGGRFKFVSYANPL